jgi:hypothetical protein
MSNPRLNRTNIRKALAYLGRTPTAIAAKLKEMGIKGRKIVPSRCPIAQYVRGAFPVAFVSAGTTFLFVNDFEVTTSRTITRFIKGFDKGKYPELVA